jgi:predicted house-cleaning noncanonical NTP pyrophosphatase (MazG superfamily)
MKKRTFRLNKLVRDKIVKHHFEMGGRVDYKKLASSEHNKALLTKLIEEAKELRDSNFEVGEIADLQEIIDQLAKNLKLSKKEISAAQTKKRKLNGGFKKGDFINTVTLPADNKWAKYYASDPKRFPEQK